MQSLATRADNWTPPILKTVASEGKGIAELAEAITKYYDFIQHKGLTQKKRTENWRQRLLEMLRDSLMERVMREHMANGEASSYAAQIAQHERDPYTLVEEIVGGLVRK